MRGLQWFNALSVGATPVSGLPDSLKVADGVVGEHAVRFLAVVTDEHNRFPAHAVVKSGCWKVGGSLRRWMKPSRKATSAR